jgi:hypothetical protein
MGQAKENTMWQTTGESSDNGAAVLFQPSQLQAKPARVARILVSGQIDCGASVSF